VSISWSRPASCLPPWVRVHPGTRALSYRALSGLAATRKLPWHWNGPCTTSAEPGAAPVRLSRERIAELQGVRANQTVEFDVAAAYVDVLLARASRRVQEEAIRRAEAILDNTRTRR
jgi:hypothetical protein